MKGRNPEGDREALAGAALISEWLPRVVEQPDDLEARRSLLEGVHAGAALASAGLGLGHAGPGDRRRYGLPHGAMNALAPAGASFNEPVAGRGDRTLRRGHGHRRPDRPRRGARAPRRLRAPTRLRRPGSELDEVAEGVGVGRALGRTRARRPRRTRRAAARCGSGPGRPFPQLFTAPTALTSSTSEPPVGLTASHRWRLLVPRAAPMLPRRPEAILKTAYDHLRGLPMEFRILGPLEVELNGAPMSLKGHKPRALLGLLLLHRNQPVAPEQLIDDLWGESAPATAANTVQVYVSQVRKIVSDRLKTEAGAYRLHVEADELDAERFERLAVEGARRSGEVVWRGVGAAGRRARPVARSGAVRPAVRLLRSGEIARLEELRLAAVEDRIEAELGLGRHDQLIGSSRRSSQSSRAGAASRLSHAGALPRGPPGGRPRGLPGGPRGATRRARARAGPRAARAGAGDPPPGRGALAAAVAPEQRARSGQHARRAAARARGDHQRAREIHAC